MVSYEKFTLQNGLQVYIHQDKTTPIAAFNLLYNVGARDEDENKTGFAHLFEHLMFGGSVNIPVFDEPLQQVGGENNAFTSNDITNYYITLPVSNLETAFWLESDRMLSLNFDEKSLETQRKVVIEEFKQRYLNQPYGNAWLHLRPLAYKTHPYRWATIGKEISHIEDATMEDVKHFFKKFYIPNNAVLVVAGNVTTQQIKDLAEKWFAPIPAGTPYVRNLPQEEKQTEARITEIFGKVPQNAIYKAYKMPNRLDRNYYVADLMGDILGRGKSSRLYQKLVKQKPFFNELSAYISGSADEGLLVIQGNLNDNITLEEANKAIETVVDEFLMENLSEIELEKVKNKAISTLLFSEVELLNRAMNLAYFAALGKVEMINEEENTLANITVKDIKEVAEEILCPTNCSTLFYRKQL